MRKIAMLLCLTMVLGLFAGCAGETPYVPTGNALEDPAVTQATDPTAPGALEPEPEAVTMAYYEADGFNPYLCGGFTNRLMFSLLYQGLFTVDREYQVEPMLCKSYTMSDNMRSYTFYLEAATFSDGSYVWAEDVVASLKAAQESDVYSGRFRHITNMEATAADCVTITTDCAYENLPLLLDIPIVKADQVAETMPIGSGPYVLIQTAAGPALQRRSDWWCQSELPISAQIVSLRAATSTAQIRDWFEFEDLSIAYADPGAASYVDYRCDYEVWDCETGLFLYLGCSDSSKVFSNEEVRAALTYAIDRELLLEEYYNGFGQTATVPASANSPYYDKGLANQIGYEPERFQQALSNNGMIGETVVLLVNKNDSVRLQAARSIAQMLTDCGLEVEVLDHSTSYYKEKLHADAYDLYLGQTRLSANMDLTEFYRPYGNLSYGSMADEACYSMCLEALENSGNYYNLHQLTVRSGQLTPILFRTYAVYTKRGLLNGFSPARDNLFWYSLGKTMTDALITE